MASNKRKALKYWQNFSVMWTADEIEKEPEETSMQLQSKKRQYSYSDIVHITNNFERTIGKGGFGAVYFGCIGDTLVAVKMLSASSLQGHQQFQAEVFKCLFGIACWWRLIIELVIYF